jgi:hypothetical protein
MRECRMCVCVYVCVCVQYILVNASERRDGGGKVDLASNGGEEGAVLLATGT